jgi:hypothetical protein
MVAVEMADLYARGTLAKALTFPLAPRGLHLVLVLLPPLQSLGIATAIFLLAVIHTFFAARFVAASHTLQLDGTSAGNTITGAIDDEGWHPDSRKDSPDVQFMLQASQGDQGSGVARGRVHLSQPGPGSRVVRQTRDCFLKPVVEVAVIQSAF